jgi:hypothetical protein
MNSQQLQKNFFLPSWRDFGRCFGFRVLKGWAGTGAGLVELILGNPKLEIEMIEVGNGR